MASVVITTKDLRENMTQVINQVSAGQDVTVTLGRGKGKKIVQLSAAKPIKSTNKKSNLINFLNSDDFKKSKHKLAPELEYQDSYKEAKSKILKSKYAN
jgi:antitoxin (DNA-binding transcriptional repressor) of toxin-antitoxin stability system